MPVSHPGQLTTIAELMRLTYAESMLDIGVGFGKWGFLYREYMELDPELNIYDHQTWRRRVDGIEIFPGYIQPHHRHLYSNLYIGNALDILPTLEHRYDLTMLIDVLEHFTRDDGERLLHMVLAKSRSVIVSVPKDIGGEGSNFGYNNEYERHRYEWSRRELAAFGPTYFLRDKRSLIAYIGPDTVKLRLRRHPRALTMLNRLRLRLNNRGARAAHHAATKDRGESIS